ncbi:MAG: hypothetical protein HKN04_10270 [Rhodothermaceae bacterium]|nr:hypothetical protein [Rhodothermaceae bacterium]
MTRFFLLSFGHLVFSSLGLSPQVAAQAQGAAEAVVVNGRTLDAPTRVALARTYGIETLPGAYWYDPASGAWGFDGGPTVGLLPAGLPAAPLRADASRGRTGVFINGRQLPTEDLRALEALVGQPVQRGRYWVDAQGYAGFEGGPALVNLAQLARQTRGSGGFHRSWATDTGVGSRGGTSYVMGRDWSVTVDH